MKTVNVTSAKDDKFGGCRPTGLKFMRLTEIKDKVNRTAIPTAIYNQIMAVDVGSVVQESPTHEQQLADEMRQAVETDNIFLVPLSVDSKRHLLYNSLPNLINKANEGMDTNLSKSLQKFQARLHAKLTVPDASQ
jgi:hypothetical protein